MAEQICNNDNCHVFGLQKLKGFYQSLIFRRRKSEAVKGIKEKEKRRTNDNDNLKERISSVDMCEEDNKGAYGGVFYKFRTKENKIIRAVKYLGVDSKDEYGGVFIKVQEKEIEIIRYLKVEKKDATKTEIDILKSLGRHPSIVRFILDTEILKGVVMVEMEYVETDLRSYIADLEKEEGFTINEVKKLMRQLLEGVKFLHENGVMHGDLKPDNILISKGKGGGDLKICNFGKATRFSRWYRAPELQQLVGVKGYYSSEVDMWNVGCIMAELVLDKVGEDEEDEVCEIYRILGQPAYSSKKRSSSINSYAKFVLKEDGFDLLKGLLSKDPSKRITAESALNHVWFHDHED